MQNITLVGLINFLIALLLGGCVIYLVHWFIGLLSLPQPVKTVILIVVGIVGLLFLLNLFGLYAV